jgi:excisionase family DNA binding protein
MQNDSSTQIIGAAEAARRLQVSRPTITRMAQSGKITPLHKMDGLRGAYVFTDAEVARAAQERGR